MPERVPADSAQLGLMPSRNNSLLLNVVCPPRPISIRICKQPFTALIFSSVGKQRCDQTRSERNLPLRVPRLYVPDLAHNPCTLYQHRVAVEIEITPLQTENLTYSKAQTHRNQDHRAPGFIEIGEEFPAFICR